MAIRKRYFYDGTLKNITYFRDHMYHRDDGPAFISYRKDGSILVCEFWKNNVQLFPPINDYEDWGAVEHIIFKNMI